MYFTQTIRLLYFNDILIIILFVQGNSSLEDAINWIADHEDDPDIDQMPSV
ncbi:putative UBA-like superfamily protein [Helianthus anomalus]